MHKSSLKQWALLVLSLPMLSGLAYSWDDSADNYYSMDDNAMLHFQQGQKWMVVSQYRAAISEYQIGIRLKPASAMSAALYNNMGLAYLKLREVPKAVISFQKAIDLDPMFSLYYENLAKAYRQGNALDQAIADLKRNLNTQPNNATGWYMLGVMYEIGADMSAAKSAYKKYIKLAPNATLTDAAKDHLSHTE